MKFCKYCGRGIDENAIFCSNCGARVSGDNPHVNTNPFDRYNPGNSAPVYNTEGSKFVAIISFLCWQAGLILWLLWRNTQPGKARSAAKGALANACVGMPILGAVLWLVWKDDVAQKDYAKVCGISAIVGVAIVLISFVLMFVLTLIGALDPSFETSFPYGDMMATVLNLLR